MGTKGQIYLTVPAYMVGPQAPPPPGGWVPAVYYIAPGRPQVKVADGIGFPNGLTLSRDEKTLYVNDTQGEYMVASDVNADGTLSNRRNFARYEGTTKNPQTGSMTSGADGLAIDSEGRLYAATAAGVQVFNDKGERLGTIPVSRSPQNLAFAGPGKRTLYIVGRGAAWKVEMLARGFAGRAK
jgi:gluconolactonase